MAIELQQQHHLLIFAQRLMKGLKAIKGGLKLDIHLRYNVVKVVDATLGLVNWACRDLMQLLISVADL